MFAYPNTGPTTATTDNFPVWTIWTSVTSGAAPSIEPTPYAPLTADNLARDLARLGYRDVEPEELRDWRGSLTRLGRRLASYLAQMRAAAIERERLMRRRRSRMPKPPPPRRRLRTCSSSSARAAMPPGAFAP